jgi:hypothetical protein
MFAPCVDPVLVPVADLQCDQDAGHHDHQVDERADPIVVAQASGESSGHASCQRG